MRLSAGIASVRDVVAIRTTKAARITAQGAMTM